VRNRPRTILVLTVNHCVAEITLARDELPGYLGPLLIRSIEGRTLDSLARPGRAAGIHEVLENVLVSPILARRIGDRAPRTSQPRRPGPAPGPRTPSRGTRIGRKGGRAEPTGLVRGLQVV